MGPPIGFASPVIWDSAPGPVWRFFPRSQRPARLTPEIWEVEPLESGAVADHLFDDRRGNRHNLSAPHLCLTIQGFQGLSREGMPQPSSLDRVLENPRPESAEAAHGKPKGPGLTKTTPHHLRLVDELHYTPPLHCKVPPQSNAVTPKRPFFSPSNKPFRSSRSGRAQNIPPDDVKAGCFPC